MQFPKKRKFAFVLWNDAHSPTATAVYDLDTINTVHGSMPIITSGWVLKQDEKGITLGAEYCGDNDYRGITHIPASMLVEVAFVTPPRKKVSKNGREGKEEVLTSEEVERFKEMVS